MRHRSGPWFLVIAGCLSIGTTHSAAGEPQIVGDVVVHRELRYREGASKHLTLDLAMPREASGGPRPAIVVIHGGGWIEGDKSSFSTLENRPPGNIFDFAALGFVAATINYRLAGEAPYPAGFDDCRAAVDWLRAHAGEYQVDPQRIGAWGNSAGGHLALLLAATDTNPATRLRAVVSDSGPLDLNYQDAHDQLRVVVRRFMGGPPDGARVADYQRASPTSYAAADFPPMMLIYGGHDEQVDIRTADEFVAALSRAGHKDLTYLRLAAAGHCPHSLVRVPHVRQAVDDFFVRVLQPIKPGSGH